MWATTKASPVIVLAFVVPASPSLTYANGNQTNLTATGESISWNALNQPISMNGVSATYDAPRLFARMVESGSGSSYQQFVFTPDSNLFAIYNAGTSTLIKGTVPLPAGDTAIYAGTALSYFRHTDWLGSSRLATTLGHAVYSKTAYAPFGETYNEAGTADRSFTGQDQDVVSGSGGTGAYDFLYRKQDPSAGRWLSPDPYGWGAVDQTNPQSLNRYSYVMNGPLSLIDQLGLCPQEYAVYSSSSTYYNGVYQGTTWTLQYTFWGDNGIPCGLPPAGCQYYINANGAYQGMQCNSGWASMATYCASNACPTGQSGGNAASNPAYSAPPGVCQAVVFGQFLNQMNSVVSTANQNIKNGWTSGVTGTLGKAAIAFAITGRWPAANALATSYFAGGAWTTLQQIPKVASGVYDAGKQATKDSKGCGGGS